MHHKLAGGIALDVGPLARGRGGEGGVVGANGNDRVRVEGSLRDGETTEDSEAEKEVNELAGH